MSDNEYYEALWRQSRLTGCLITILGMFAAAAALCLARSMTG